MVLGFWWNLSEHVSCWGVLQIKELMVELDVAPVTKSCVRSGGLSESLRMTMQLRYVVTVRCDRAPSRV
jgi:hypothetical protein